MIGNDANELRKEKIKMIKQSPSKAPAANMPKVTYKPKPKPKPQPKAIAPAIGVKIYDSVKSGKIKLDDLNEDGIRALREHMERTQPGKYGDSSGNVNELRSEKSQMIKQNPKSAPAVSAKKIAKNVNYKPALPGRNIPVIGPILKGLDVVGEKIEPAADVMRTLYTPGAGLANVAGFTGAVGSKLAQLAPNLGKTTVGRIGAEAVKEGVTGVPLAMGQSLAQGGDLKEAAKQGVVGGVLGAGGGAAFQALSPVLGKAFNNFITRHKSVAPETEQATKALLTPTKQAKISGPLKPASQNTYIDRVMSDIRPIVTERMTPPLENPKELAKWLQPHLGDTSLNELRKLSYDDMVELANEVKNNLSTYEMAKIVATERGYNIDDILNGKLPSIKERVKLDASKRVYGIYDAPKVEVARPKTLEEIVHGTPEQAPKTLDEIVNSTPTEAPKKLDEIVNGKTGAASKPVGEIINSSETPVAPTQALSKLDEIVNGGTGLSDDVQAMAANPINYRQANTGAKVKPITRQQVLGSIRKRFGVTVRTGRLGTPNKSVLGIHKKTPEVIRSRMHGDLQTISHELGHNLDKRYNLQEPQYQQELTNLLHQNQTINIGAYQPHQIHAEGVAEFIRLYLTDPQTAHQLAPNFAKYFESATQNIRKELAATQEDIARWIDQGEAMQFRGKINRTGKTRDKTVGTRIHDIYESFVDRFHQLAVAEKAITGKVGDAANSLYKRARLAVGAPKKAELIMKDLQEAMKPLDKFGYKMKDLGDYAAAVHARNLEAQGIETGFTKAEIDATLRKFGTPEMEMVRKRLVMYNNNLLDMLVDGGVLSQDAVNAMRQKHPDYVPFYRFFDEDMSFGGSTGKGFADITNPVKRLKGSTRDVIDPIESMVKNTFAVVNAVEKNKVGLELGKLADVDGAGRFIERLDGKQNVSKENIVTVWENGEKVQYQLEPELYRAMKQLDEESANTLVKILSVPASTLRAGATLTPEFMLRNPIRDQFQAFTVSNFGYNPLIDLPVGVFHAVLQKLGKTTKTYEMWVREGGGYGNFISMDRNYVREQLQQLRNEKHPLLKGTVAIVNPKQWLRLLRAMSELSEEGTKLGEFSRGLRKGHSPAEAAFQSRDLMDFGRSGNNVKQINRVVSFLNANIQGKDRLARAFKKHPVRTTIRAVTAVTLPTIGIYYWNEAQSNKAQRETIDNAPQWLKDTFWLVSIPGTEVVARIPKPFDLAPVFANPIENMMKWYHGEDHRSAGEQIKATAVDLLKIPYMLTGIMPVLENVSNYSFFTGGPIVPQRDQDLESVDQYDVNTSLTARAIGKKTGYSPYKVDNLIRGYGAGLGKYTTKGVDKVIEATGLAKLPPKEKAKVSELPVINTFTVDSTGGGQVMTDFYDTLDKLNKQEQSNKKNGKKDEKVEKHAKSLRSASRDISDLRTEYREIQESFKLRPAVKRKKLDDLDRKMKDVARKAIQKVGKR